jgi:hypothetical protein
VLKQRPVEAGLADDALEGTAAKGSVEGYWDGDRGSFCLQLHDAVTAALAHGHKSRTFENLAGISA